MVTGRVKTGVKNLDKLIKGFKENSINLVAGAAGSGKTIFALQFLMEGLRGGEGCIYIAFGGNKKEIYSDIKTLKWDLEKYDQMQKFAFIETAPEQVKRWINEGGGEIEEIIYRMKAKRIVIDGIDYFTLLYPNELSRKEAAESLFEILEGLGCTTVITTEAMEGEDSSKHIELETEVDSVILIYHAKKDGVRRRGLEVLKMKGTKIPDKTFSMEITSNGIEIDIKK